MLTHVTGEGIQDVSLFHAHRSSVIITREIFFLNSEGQTSKTKAGVVQQRGYISKRVGLGS